LKAGIKKILGRPAGGYSGNVSRNRFNEMIRSEYEGKEPLFDLAYWEATLPDGERSVFTWEGATYDSLAGEYTEDGGHLNRDGSRWVAERFLVFLAGL
jgi:hypothetical protein